METNATNIIYQPRDTKFYSRLAFPIGYQNKLESDLRYYRNKEEYGSVLLKEAILVGFFLVIFLGLFIWLNINTIKWAMFLPFSALLVVLFVWAMYTRKVNKFHKQPQSIYQQIQQYFEGTGIDNNTLIEQSVFCFKFRKNDLDCELSYNIYRKVYHLYIYPPSSAIDLDLRADKFVEESQGNWFYDEDEDGFFLAYTIRPEEMYNFKELLSSDTLLAKQLF